MTLKSIGVLGATSPVGTCILQQLVTDSCQIIAFSRKIIQQQDHPQINWKQLGSKDNHATEQSSLPLWICVAPIWTLPEYFSLFLSYGVQRIVVVSSTSRFSKTKSSNVDEKTMAQRLTSAETTVKNWAAAHKIEWIVLRPTLIYGLGRDKNVSEIARFIRRFGFFPLLSAANGLRQPIHTKDVASACIAALNSLKIKNRSYNLAGNETLTYREMITRIFSALNKTPRFIRVPYSFFQLAIFVLNRLPRYRHWTTAMAERMNQDMVYDITPLQQDLHFSPGRFFLSKEDMPSIEPFLKPITKN